MGEHFSKRRRHQGLSRRLPGARVETGMEIASPARCTKPVIAANKGYCFGVGFEVSLACDFRICTEKSLYALPEQKLGQIPGSGGSAPLQKMGGYRSHQGSRHASTRIPGLQAYRAGASRSSACPKRNWSSTDHLLCECAPSCLTRRSLLLKKLLNDTEDAPLSIAIELEAHSQPVAQLGRLPGGREGVSREAESGNSRAVESILFQERMLGSGTSSTLSRPRSLAKANPCG